MRESRREIDLATRVDEDSLLAAARRGDESAFGQLADRYRTQLHAHCYRMLGSVHDADDVLQEVLIRAWQGLQAFEGRSSLRSWLYRIATNACMSALAGRSRRALPVDLGPAARAGEPVGEPVAEDIWISPYPEFDHEAGAPEQRLEQREAVELAFVAALQHLPVTQRATLILRDVLGFSAAEVAAQLGTTSTAVNSALQHARRNVEARVPARSQQATLTSLGDTRLSELVGDYVRALETGDVDALVRLLAADATWAMPPTRTWYQGHEAINDFLLAAPLRARWRHLPTRANSQLAVAGYVWAAGSHAFVPFALDVLTVSKEQITAVTAFLDPGLFERFDLPAALQAR